MRIALCPGSYDPVTKGHLNIIERTSRMFDKVVVVVLVNPSKNYTFTREERVGMLQKTTSYLPNVEVEFFDGLIADYARQKSACVLVKGLRAVTDFEYEFQMALINKKLNPELETIFITTDVRFMYLSSSSVREVARFGGDFSDFVPPELEAQISKRLCRPKEKEE